MKPYIYKEILAKHKFNSELKKINYNFFNLLEDAVYEGLSADEFREKYDLPQIKYFKKTAITDSDGFEHIVNDEAVIPYWEIHHYKSGFSDDAASIRINGTSGDRFNKIKNYIFTLLLRTWCQIFFTTTFCYGKKVFQGQTVKFIRMKMEVWLLALETIR